MGRIPLAVDEEIPIPEPDSDEVLVEVAACGVCRSDVHILRKNDDNYMFFAGYSGFPTIIG